MPTTKKKSNTPQHLGVIIDGNRRWAKENGLPTIKGHQKGADKISEVMGWCKSKGVKTLTIFCFSTENWNRSKNEINYLMRLMKKMILNSFKKVHKEGIKIRIIGQKERLPKFLQKEINRVEKLTKNNKEMIVNFALSYGGRAEIVDAFKNIIKKNIDPDKITERTISENLLTSDLDLIIRTGKEQRISNFLIWQAAYSEFYFSPKYWPDFAENDLDDIFLEYKRRQRRFGK